MANKKISNLLIFIFALAIFFFSSSIALAATYYINVVNGNDNNSGTSSQPWKTIAKGANNAIAGDTVIVCPGVYSERLVPANSGSSGAMITFKAETARTAILDGTGIANSCVSLPESRAYIRVEGFELRNFGWECVYSRGNNNQIVNNYIHNNGDQGINASGTNILIENNEIAYNGTDSILIGADNLTIRGNNIHHNGKDGIFGGGSNWLVENNVFHDQFGGGAHEDAIQIEELTNSIIRNNIFHDFTQLLYLANYSQSTYENISIYGNIFYTDTYNTQGGGEAPGIFIVAGNDASILRNIDIHSNTFGWLGYPAIRIYKNDLAQGSNIKIYDNIFYESGIDVGDNFADQVTSNYNLFYNASSLGNEGPNSIFADPQFVNYQKHSAFDFHLKSTSPAINIGSQNLSTIFVLPSPFLDIDGTQRPQGIRYDLGAYEYVSSPPPPATVYGDISGNSQLDSSDALMAAQYSLGLISLTSNQITLGDVSGNGSVTAYDAALILLKLAGIISKFPIE
jgi:hypothetical protein